jgi:GNAT superfamily N-acetyltransferase
MGSVPGNDQEWARLARSGQPPFWKLLAESSGGAIWEREGVVGSIINRSPDRSVFNSVFYEQPDALIASIDDLAATYDEAGVRAWTVWVPEADTEVAEALAAAGHVLDATPREMGMEIAELVEPEPDPELEIREESDLELMGEINKVAYGYAEGEYAPFSVAEIPGTRVYFGAIDGETVATLATWKHGSDCPIEWVATLPEARGRGLSKRLLAHALRDAGEAGLVTTTLQSTKLGYPVYAALGYRDYGEVQMWERRQPK